jgi:hypothetical protein
LLANQDDAVTCEEQRSGDVAPRHLIDGTPLPAMAGPKVVMKTMKLGSGILGITGLFPPEASGEASA